MPLKLSSYLVFSESVTEKNKFLVYSTRTSKLLKISRELGLLLKVACFDQIPRSIVDALIADKVIIDKGENELRAIMDENRGANTVLKRTLYEVVQPSAWCQLGCHYCGQDHKRKLLDDFEIEGIVGRIGKKLDEGNFTALEIGWFGGEPLSGLSSMRKINQKLKELATMLNIVYKAKIVTNGVSLRPSVFEELVKDFNCVRFEITLDGIEEFHDRNRGLKTAKGSFYIIYNNILNIFNSRFFQRGMHSFAIRCNVNRDNADGIEPLLYKIAEDRVHEKIDSMYFMSIYSWAQNNAHSNSFTKEEFAMLRLKWECLKIKLGYPYSFILPRERKYNTCMATDSTSEMYDPYGNIFNCTETSLTEAYENSGYFLGNVKFRDRDLDSRRMFSDWFDQIEKNPTYQCHTCRVFPICGGGCPKSWSEGNAPCPTFRNSIGMDIKLKEIMSDCRAEKREERIDFFMKSIDITDFSYDQNR